MQPLETAKYKNKSPSKNLRSLRRLVSFRKKKSSPPKTQNLTISYQQQINIYPSLKMRNLIKENVSSVNVLPCKKSQHLSFSIPMICSINPSPSKRIHHPNIIETCRMLYDKHPDKLSHEEREHFSSYRQYKINNGQPIEEDSAYNPI